MTRSESKRLDALEGKLDAMAGAIEDLKTNHLYHIKHDLESLHKDMEETKDYAEQALGTADSAAKDARRTEKMVGGAAVLITIVMTMIQCFG